ncbi:hypothetical protein HDU98_009539 [Podochytrium sp. JEL0797]|nr:hypothetical protein HDU98_009539 [Podochytrium sp. JEL0797]
MQPTRLPLLPQTAPSNPPAATRLTPSDRVPLLTRGILITDNSFSLQPLESLVTVNQHNLNIRPITLVKPKRPIRAKLAKESQSQFPALLGEHDRVVRVQGEEKEFGFGPYYENAFHPTQSLTPFMNFRDADSAVHPQNADPVHDGKPKCVEFEGEKVAGTRWLLQHLPYSEPRKLPQIYQFPGAVQAYQKGKRNWATGTSEIVDGMGSKESNASLSTRTRKGLSKLRFESLQTEIHPSDPDTTTAPHLPTITTPPSTITKLVTPHTAVTPASPLPPATPPRLANIVPKAMKYIPHTPNPELFIAAFMPGPSFHTLPASCTTHAPNTPTARTHRLPFQLVVNGKVNVRVVSSRQLAKCLQFPALVERKGFEAGVVAGQGGFSRAGGGMGRWGCEVREAVRRSLREDGGKGVVVVG